MSIQSALSFIQNAREDEGLTLQLQTLSSCSADLESVINLAEVAGFTFTAEELRVAFKHDWAMRWFQQEKRDSS